MSTEPPRIPPSRVDGVVDDYHGTPVADPYRWLEDGASAEVADWVATQNAFTRSILDGDPDRAVWHRLLVRLMRRPLVQGAVRRGEHLFCWERGDDRARMLGAARDERREFRSVEEPSNRAQRGEGAEQFVLTRRSAVDREAPPVTLLDPATLSTDAATAVDWYEPSPDGSVIAIGLSDGGTEDSTLHLVSGVDGAPAGGAGDEIPNTRACSVAWEPDGGGFFYTRYPDGDRYHRTVHRHSLGADWTNDPVVWAEHPDPQAWPSVELSADGRWLLVAVSVGWSRTDVHLLDRDDDHWTTVIAGNEANTSLTFAADGRSLVGVTTLDAPRGRVVRVSLEPGQPEAGPAGWQSLVGERDDVISRLGVTVAGLVLVTSGDAVDRVWLLDNDGAPVVADPVDLGGLVTVDAVVADVRSADWYVVVNSFGAPPALWRGSGEPTRWCPLAEADDAPPADLAVTRMSYPSDDGTEIGLFLIHRPDVTPSPDTPTILNGYGGFSITLGPGWQPRIAAWCAAGGLYAIAGLRGGSEHGEDWHDAGRRAAKQNVFDDFHAAADFLVAEGWTSRPRLAVYGGSNGGLLVGVALTQRPDLCAAVLCAVPLLDMVRFPRFLIARLWTSEYGDPDVTEEFNWLYPYSPYHHVVAGTDYPATLLQTADGDSRVDPLHARKMAALLQSAAADQQRRPVLLYQEERAGHGVGKPVSKLADTVADGLTFLGRQLGLHPPG